jgi:hypothetical protein
MYDYEGIISNIVMPKLMDVRYTNPWRQLLQYATEDKKKYGGGRITIQVQTGQTSNAANYTRSSVDAVADTAEFATAYWDKIYQQAAGEVHNIDLSEAEAGGLPAVEDLLTKAVNDAFDGLWDLIFDDILAQWRLDILNSGDYSDASLSRTTYPLLTVYNDVVNATITEADLDDAQYNVKLDHNNVNPRDYMWRMGPAVDRKLQPQLALFNNWTAENNDNMPIDGGAAPIKSYGGAGIDVMNGMTTGDVMYLRMKDSIVHRHMALRRVVKPTGADSIKVNLYTGINGYVLNPGLQALLANKD